MLVLTRKADQGIVINGDIVVTVLEVAGERVKLGIRAPRNVAVVRQELAAQVRRENLAAARWGRLPPAVRPALQGLLAGRRPLPHHTPAGRQ